MNHQRPIGGAGEYLCMKCGAQDCIRRCIRKWQLIAGRYVAQGWDRGLGSRGRGTAWDSGDGGLGPGVGGWGVRDSGVGDRGRERRRDSSGCPAGPRGPGMPATPELLRITPCSHPHPALLHPPQSPPLPPNPSSPPPKSPNPQSPLIPESRPPTPESPSLNPHDHDPQICRWRRPPRSFELQYLTPARRTAQE